MAAIFLHRPPSFPFIALVVSGGHTNIYLAESFGCFKVLGQTRDDAAGEAFDKAAKLLNIGYPGGVVIDRLAKQGDRQKISFPRAMKGSLDFSFSGLKTSLLTYLKKRDLPPQEDEVPDICASFQEAICEVLAQKTLLAAVEHHVPRVVVCGGVAANSRLREKFSTEALISNIDIFFPPPVLCTDNAAMIAVVGDHLLREGRQDRYDLNAVSRWPLDRQLEARCISGIN